MQVHKLKNLRRLAHIFLQKILKHKSVFFFQYWFVFIKTRITFNIRQNVVNATTEALQEASTE